MNKSEKAEHRWAFFLSLERDLLECRDTVEFAESNLKTFSMRFGKILLTTCVEIECVLKELCAELAPNNEWDNKHLPALLREVENSCPSFSTAKVRVTVMGKELVPWERPPGKDVPGWWTGYNQVKHSRFENFAQANLGHAIDAMGGLFVALAYWWWKVLKERLEQDSMKAPRLFGFISREQPTEHQIVAPRWIHDLDEQKY